MFTMGDWEGEQRPSCPFCTEVIEEGEEFYESTNTGGVAHWPCFVQYCNHRGNHRIMAPPTFHTEEHFTEGDYQRLVDDTGREWPQAVRGRYKYKINDGLPQAHPKERRAAARKRRETREEQARWAKDGDWTPRARRHTRIGSAAAAPCTGGG